MSSLWEKNYKPTEMKLPEEILEEQCKELEHITSGYIMAKTIAKTYESNYYKKKYGQFHFEMYITSTYTKNFKYSILSIEYNLPFYPITVSIDEDIALEQGIDTKEECQSENDLENLLSKVLNSKKVETTINSLLTIVYKEKKQEEENIPF